MDSTEASHIAISVVTLSVAFAFVMTRDVASFPFFVVLSFFTVGIGFILHELAHKFVAQRFGCTAGYRLWKEGLAMALIFSIVFRFVFAAPGAVWIYKQYLSTRENGIISVAGPVMNLVLAAIFSLIEIQTGNTLIQGVAFWGFRINLILALFNMIPFGPLDGRKVFVWNPAVWAIVFAIPAFLLYFPK